MTIQPSDPSIDPGSGARPGRIPLLVGLVLTGISVALPLGYIALVLLVYASSESLDGLGVPQWLPPVVILAALPATFVVVLRSLWGGTFALAATALVGSLVVLAGLVMVMAQVFIMPVFIWGLVVVLAGSLLVAGAVRTFRARHRDALPDVDSDTDGEYPVAEPDHDAGAAP